MRFAYLKYRLKKMGCYLLIIILLPYIITVFLSGPGAYGASRVDETMVNVKADVFNFTFAIYFPSICKLW